MGKTRSYRHGYRNTNFITDDEYSQLDILSPLRIKSTSRRDTSPRSDQNRRKGRKGEREASWILYKRDRSLTPDEIANQRERQWSKKLAIAKVKLLPGQTKISFNPGAITKLNGASAVFTPTTFNSSAIPYPSRSLPPINTTNATPHHFARFVELSQQSQTELHTRPE